MFLLSPIILSSISSNIWSIYIESLYAHSFALLQSQLSCGYVIRTLRKRLMHPGPGFNRRFIVRYRKDLKLHDLYSELCNGSEIWQVPQQQCCWGACQISKQFGNLNYQFHSFETPQDLKIRRLFGYWNWTLVLVKWTSMIWVLLSNVNKA